MERHAGKTAVDYPRSKDGFRFFCERMNKAHTQQEQNAKFLDADLLWLLRDVPCRGEVIRYIEWHNLAFATALDMGLETYVLHYDWYKNRFNQTVSELLDFLQLQARAEPHPFIEGKEYRDYFTEQERDNVRIAFQRLSSKTTWKHIERYFVT
jgi:hypothetical protein